VFYIIFFKLANKFNLNKLVHKWWRVAIIYLAGVLAGSMGHSIADPNVLLAGASGGVYALITAHIAKIILNWHEMKYGPHQLFFFLAFCGYDFGTSIYRHLTAGTDNIGYMVKFTLL
jgi:membrane associated rhomboid family serine protease